MPANERISRVNSAIAQTLSGILMQYGSPLKYTTITEVRTSRDLSVAKVFWNFLPVNNINQTAIEKALAQDNKKIRYLLANQIKIRRTPKLHFAFDELIGHINQIEQLIENTKQ